VTPQGIHDAAVFDAIASGGKIMLPNATCCLQLVHAQDAARAVEAAIRLRDSTIGQTFNVGGAPLTPVAYVQASAPMCGLSGPNRPE
jgi:nucleoside-diphosphate-sugar epimerase